MQKSKKPVPDDQAFVIPIGDVLYCNFIELLKFQIANPKHQINPNDQNSKIQTVSCHVRFWSLDIGI
jgi:hypothetical protein